MQRRCEQRPLSAGELVPAQAHGCNCGVHLFSGERVDVKACDLLICDQLANPVIVVKSNPRQASGTRIPGKATAS